VPRAGLTTQRVITEAATVADEVGLDRLTLAAVAQRCGVSLPGLYKHVSGLEEVKRGISIAAIRELTASAAAAAAEAAASKGIKGAVRKARKAVEKRAKEAQRKK